MPHSYTSCLMHIVFSTKERRDLIPKAALPRLREFIGGIARKNAMKTLAIGGTQNHTHSLVSLPSTVSIAKAVQLIKGGSSKFIRQTFPQTQTFAWQQGYGAFSVSITQQARTIAYIENQTEHHRTKTFEEEFIAFLKKHRIEYDAEHVWG